MLIDNFQSSPRHAWAAVIVDDLQLIAVHYLLAKRIPKIPDWGDRRWSDEKKEIFKSKFENSCSRQPPRVIPINSFLTRSFIRFPSGHSLHRSTKIIQGDVKCTTATGAAWQLWQVNQRCRRCRKTFDFVTQLIDVAIRRHNLNRYCLSLGAWGWRFYRIRLQTQFSQRWKSDCRSETSFVLNRVAIGDVSEDRSMISTDQQVIVSLSRRGLVIREEEWQNVGNPNLFENNFLRRAIYSIGTAHGCLTFPYWMSVSVVQICFQTGSVWSRVGTIKFSPK